MARDRLSRFCASKKRPSVFSLRQLMLSCAFGVMLKPITCTRKSARWLFSWLATSQGSFWHVSIPSVSRINVGFCACWVINVRLAVSSASVRGVRPWGDRLSTALRILPKVEPGGASTSTSLQDRVCRCPYATMPKGSLGFHSSSSTFTASLAI